jgi:hypothetical protein
MIIAKGVDGFVNLLLGGWRKKFEIYYVENAHGQMIIIISLMNVRRCETITLSFKVFAVDLSDESPLISTTRIR